MKKAFPLEVPRRDRARVLDAIKHEVRKYVKRERKKPLPDGFEEWVFECRVGREAESAELKNLKDISAAIDEVAATGGPTVYIELKAFPAQRPARR